MLLRLMLPRFGVRPKGSARGAIAKGVFVPWLSTAACLVAAGALWADDGGPGISGRVLDENGQPVVGAVVEVLPTLGPGARLRHRLDGTTTAAVDRTLTGDDGRYQLPPRPLGLWTLRVRADGMLDARRHLTPLREGLIAEDLRMLRSDARLRIRVVDDEGRPVTGAAVDVDLEWRGRSWHSGRRTTGKTDEQGVFATRCPRTPGVTPGAGSRPAVERVRAVARLRVSERKWLTSDVITGAGAGELALRLRSRAKSLPLRFHRQGRPLPQVAVVDALGPVALGDAEGRVDLAHDPKWLSTLRVVTADRIVEWPALDIPGGPAETDTSDPQPGGRPLDVEIPAAQVWTGEVVSDEGFPVADAMVFSRQRGTWPSRDQDAVFARTDRLGVYTVDETPGIYTLHVHAAGYLPAVVRTGWRPSTTSQGGDLEVPRVVLEPAAAVSARVVDTGGRPLAGVRGDILLQRRDQSGSRSREPILARSNARGEFRFAGLIPGATALVLLRKEGFALQEESFVVPDLESERGSPVWVLEPGLRVLGRTVDEGGEPLADVELGLTIRPSDDAPRNVRFTQGLGERFAATSDAEGTFHFDQVGTGSHRLEAQVADRLDTYRLLEVEPPGPVDLGEVVLRDGLRVGGVVLSDATDQPLAGASVVATAERRGILARGITDAQGRFTLRGLPEETVRISAHLETYREAGIVLPLPHPELIELHLPRQAGLSGQVVDTGGGAVREVRIQMSWGQEVLSASRTEVSDDGSFALDDLGEGRVEIVATAPDGRSGELQLQIEAGQQLDGLRVEVSPGADLRGRVTFDGGAVPAAEIFLLRGGRPLRDPAELPPFLWSSHADRETRSDGDGGFRFANLRPGPYWLLVRAENFQPLVRSLNLDLAGGDVAVELQRTSSIPGFVVDEFGQPIGNATVFASEFGGRHVETTTGSDGSFRLDMEPPRTVRVTAPNRPPFSTTDPSAHQVDGSLYLVLPEPSADATVSILGLDSSALAQTELVAIGRLDGGWSTSLPGSIDSEATGRIRGLFDGIWTVRAISGDRQRQREIVVAGGGEPHVELDFEDDLDLRVRLLVDGESLQGVRIRLGPPDDSPAGIDLRCFTDAVGTCLLSGVRPGHHRLLLDHWPSGLSHAQTAWVGVGEDLRLDLRTSVVSGRVVPPRAVRVRLLQGDLEAATAAGTDGTFRLRTAFAGEALLVAGGSEDSVAVPVELAPGVSLAGVELPLPATPDDAETSSGTDSDNTTDNN